MAAADIVAVVLCGGRGTRLWPLSRRNDPKQFIDLVDGGSLTAAAMRRAKALAGAVGVICATSEDYRFMAAETAARAGLEADILLEPDGCGTTVPVMCAALHVLERNRDAVIVTLPADHYVPDEAAFAATIARAAASAEAGHWPVLGVDPANPSPAFGYIVPGRELHGHPGVFEVRQFVEKPGSARAADLIENGALWHAGISVAKAQTMVDVITEEAPDVAGMCRRAMAGAQRDGAFWRLADVFDDLTEPVSLDHAVLERSQRITLTRYAGEWMDVGSWTALAKLIPPDADGNRSRGDVVFHESSGCFVHGDKRLIVAVGLNDIVIADTADALLVAAGGQLGSLREIVEGLSDQDRVETVHHRRVARPWGSFEQVDDGPGFQVKRLVVRPGASLSLQYHNHRAEHWIVVRGTARVTRGDDVFDLNENESTYIAKGVAHRLENPGAGELHMIEVQSGGCLSEDDIVRLDDHYGREKT